MKELPSSSSIFLLAREDAAAIAELEALCFSSGWDVAMYERFLPDARKKICSECAYNMVLPELAVLGFMHENAIGGYISVRYLAVVQNAEIYNVAVQPVLRGRGIATALLRQTIQLLERHGLQEMALEVRAGNKPAIALYTGNGFTVCGMRKAYYPDGEDALLMQRLSLEHTNLEE